MFLGPNERCCHHILGFLDDHPNENPAQAVARQSFGGKQSAMRFLSHFFATLCREVLSMYL